MTRHPGNHVCSNDKWESTPGLGARTPASNVTVLRRAIRFMPDPGDAQVTPMLEAPPGYRLESAPWGALRLHGGAGAAVIRAYIHLWREYVRPGR